MDLLYLWVVFQSFADGFGSADTESVPLQHQRLQVLEAGNSISDLLGCEIKMW